jgi:phosphatidylglycerophosphate synthase
MTDTLAPETGAPSTPAPEVAPDAPRMTTRDRMRSAVEPLGAAFGKVGLTPNALTLIGFAISAVAAWAAVQQAWLVAGILVAFGAVFDLFDGALARATGQASKFGAFLDSTMDRWGEAVVYVGLVVGLSAADTGVVVLVEGTGAVNASLDLASTTLGPLLAAAAMASAFMVSYARAKSESLGFTPGRGMANVGLAPREVRIVILTVGLIAAGLLRPATDLGGGYDTWYVVLVGSLALIAVLATITTIQRIVHVYREARQQEQ